MVTQRKSLTTVAMYLRCLRHLCNNAIREGVLKQSDYPFSSDGKDTSKYKMPEPKNTKIALSIDNIAKIFNYEPEFGTSEHYYRDLWLFSYLCNGINMKDICLLKYSDIKGEHLYFRRAKTTRTDRKSRPVDVILTDEVKSIIERWGRQPQLSDMFIFPILKRGLSPEKQQALIKQVTKQTNIYIKRIATKLGIKENVHFQVARHSYATILKRSGVSVEYISESLGHKNLATTNHYLGSFEDDQKRETAKHLTAFNTKKLK
jgi:integrase